MLARWFHDKLARWMHRVTPNGLRAESMPVRKNINRGSVAFLNFLTLRAIPSDTPAAAHR
jgi:hypothetical protein